MSTKNNLPTNWSDGMKINRQSFINSETALFNSIHSGIATQLTDYNYGLLQPDENQKNSLEVEVIKSQADNYIIKLTICKAITAGGIRIDVNPDVSSELTLNDRVDYVALKNNPNPLFFLLISVDYSERIPFGQAVKDWNLDLS